MPPLSRRDAILGLTGTAALATLAGCSLPAPSPPTSSPTPPPTPPPTPSGPAPIDEVSPDLTLTPLFGSADLGIDSVVVAIAGDAMLLRDDSTSIDSTDGLVVVEAATGARRWTLGDLDARLEAEGSRLHPRPPTRIAVSRAAGVTMLATYVDRCASSQPCGPEVPGTEEGYGIGAFEIATGATRWHVRMTTEAYPITAMVVDADDDRCYANVGDVGGLGVPDEAPADAETARLVALAAADGTVVWERPGLVATHVGDVVLGLERLRGGDRVVALARDSGASLWHAEVGERVTVAGRAMAALVDEAGAARIVDVATGDTLLEDSDPYPTFGDDGAGGELTAWIVRDDGGAERTYTLWSLADGIARPAAVAPPEDARFVTAIAFGYVFVDSPSATSSIALDRSGRVRSDVVEGDALRATGDGILVLGRSRSSFVYAVS